MAGFGIKANRLIQELEEDGSFLAIQFDFSRPFRDQTGADFEPFGEIGGF